MSKFIIAGSLGVKIFYYFGDQEYSAEHDGELTIKWPDGSIKFLPFYSLRVYVYSRDCDYGEYRYEWFVNLCYHGHKIKIPVSDIKEYVIDIDGIKIK